MVVVYAMSLSRQSGEDSNLPDDEAGGASEVEAGGASDEGSAAGEVVGAGSADADPDGS